jgi:exosortase A-associated hydrolase 1
VLYSLCDGASAALMYCATDARVKGLVLLNPWVRTDTTQAVTQLRYYYARRMVQAAFWRKLLSAGINPIVAATDLMRSVRKSVTRAPAPSSYIDRMLTAMNAFRGTSLLLISGQDLTASEFVELCRADDRWRRAVSSPSVTRVDLPEADHTFSTRAHLDRANQACFEWLAGAIATSTSDVQPR